VGNLIGPPGLATYQLLGKTAPPANVTGFVATPLQATIELAWDAVADLDLDSYEIRSGASWIAGTTIVKDLKATVFTWQRPADGAYTLWIKAKDTSGNYSTTATSAALAVDPEDDFVVPVEKHRSKDRWDSIIAEQTTAVTGLDAQADTAGVSRTAYDNAITALTAYLNGLFDPGPSDAWAANDWTNYALTINLTEDGNTGGGAAFRAAFQLVTDEAALLRGAIANAALEEAPPTDVFRPAITWDLGDGSDAGFTYAGGSAADSASPYAKVGRKLTWSSSALKATSPNFGASDLTGKACRVVVARVRLNSGTWVGKCHFIGVSPAITIDQANKWVQIQTPTVGEWMDVAWDMVSLQDATTDYIANTEIQQIQLELLSSAGNIDVDWVAVGTYGAGSLADYTLAIARANMNGENLIPNPNSEADLTGLPTTGPESQGVSTDAAYEGSKSRKVTSSTSSGYSTGIYVSPRIPVSVGDQYYFSAWCHKPGVGSAGSWVIRAHYWNAAGTNFSTVDLDSRPLSEGTSWGEMYGIFSIPSTAVFMDIQLTGYDVTSGQDIYFDNLILRRAADSRLIVDGSILAQHLLAGTIQSYHLSVGPMYQFKGQAAGPPLEAKNDGTFAAQSVAAVLAATPENTTDKASYVDDQRIYPATKTKTFEANFSGTGDRGFLFNLDSAFGTVTTGLRVLHSGTALTVHKVSGAAGRTYGAALTPSSGSTTASTAGTGKLTAIFSGAAGTAETRRLVLKLDGAEIAAYADSDIGGAYDGQQSGYAGLILGTHATRPGDVRVWGIGMGIGFVTIQDGNVTADTIAANAITTEKIAAQNITAAKLAAELVLASLVQVGYTENGSGYATGGVQLDGIGDATAPILVGPLGMRVGASGFLLDEITMRTLNMLDSNGEVDSTFRGWYKGNSDLTTLGGAPDISVCTVYGVQWDTTNKCTTLDLSIQPSALNDNLEAMTYAAVEILKQSAAGTTATLTAVQMLYVPLPFSRNFANVTDSNAANLVRVSGALRHSVITGGVPACKVTLYNVNGPSATHCFYSAAGWAEGTALTDNGTSWPAGITGGSGGGSGGGGGGGGGSCPAPDTLLATPDGAIRAGDVKVGTILRTQHETTLEWGDFEVVQALPAWAPKRWRLHLADGRLITASENHRYFVSGEGWVKVQHLRTGDCLAGMFPGMVEYVVPADPGQVMEISVHEAHTFQTEGVLSHNIKMMD
jgi:hypothetical protein